MSNEIKEEKHHTLTVAETKENEDGSMDIVFDLTDEFIEDFKRINNLKRFSRKRFSKWARKTLEEYALKILSENKD